MFQNKLATHTSLNAVGTLFLSVWVNLKCWFFCSLFFKNTSAGHKRHLPSCTLPRTTPFSVPFPFNTKKKTSSLTLSLSLVYVWSFYFSGPSLGVVATKWKRMRGVALTSASQWLLKQTGEDAHDGVENFGLQQTLSCTCCRHPSDQSIQWKLHPLWLSTHYTLHSTGHFIDITQLTTSGRR